MYPPRPHTPPTHISNIRRQMQQQPGGPASRLSVDTPKSFMDKIAYAKWIEGPMVRGRFSTGAYATLANAVYIPGECPKNVFIVDHIQEMHRLAAINPVTDEPKCVGVKLARYSPVIYFSPCELRPLNVEEVQLVNNRDKEARRGPVATAANQEQSAAPAAAEKTTGRSSRRRLRTAVLGGAVVIVDADTGEIVSESDDENESYCG